MEVDSIFKWILKNPMNYPGKHQEPQSRTNPAYKPLEAKAQFHIIFKATAEYIKEKLLDGKGVNVKNLGAFTFEVSSDTVKPAQFSNFDVAKDLYEQRAERKHIHKIRPCFVPDKSLRYALSRYPGKDEITAPSSQSSIYQKGFGMMFCNPGPIASACYLGKDVVTSAHEAFVKALIDLCNLGQDLTIEFGFCKLRISDKNLQYSYRKDFIDLMNEKGFEAKMRRSDQPTSDHWTTTYDKKWAASSLNTLLKRPNTQQVKEYFEKTLALKIMSLDLNTTEKSFYSKNRSSLPPIATKK